MDVLTKVRCAEVRSASTDMRIYDALPVVSTSYEDNTPLEIL
jgi:hypothetical protein